MFPQLLWVLLVLPEFSQIFTSVAITLWNYQERKFSISFINELNAKKIFYEFYRVMANGFQPIKARVVLLRSTSGERILILGFLLSKASFSSFVRSFVRSFALVPFQYQLESRHVYTVCPYS